MHVVLTITDASEPMAECGKAREGRKEVREMVNGTRES